MTDHNAIRQAALDYVEGQYEGDAQRVENCLHPLLAKRTVNFDDRQKSDRLDQLGALELVQLTREGVLKDIEPKITKVEVLDVFDTIASVRVESTIFVDYLHLGLYNGRWMVINALWKFINARA